MGDRYGRSDVNEISIGLSIWNMLYRYGIWCIDMVIYHIDMVILDIDMEYGHPGYRYGIWANDMGEDSTDMVISEIDMGSLVTLREGHPPRPVRRRGRGGAGSTYHTHVESACN